MMKLYVMGELLSFKNETPAFQNKNSTNIKEKSALENEAKVLELENKLFLLSILIPS